PLRAAWADPSPEHRSALRQGLTLEATKGQYLGGVKDPSRVDPDSWILDQALLQRPGVDEIMLGLFLDYRTNVALYPQFQQFFRTPRPPTLTSSSGGRTTSSFRRRGPCPTGVTTPAPSSTCATPGTSRWRTSWRRSPP